MSEAVKMVFCMWLDIHRIYRFVQSFQMYMVRHAQSYRKQQVSYISKMNLGMNLIHNYIYMIQPIQMSVVRPTWVC